MLWLYPLIIAVVLFLVIGLIAITNKDITWVKISCTWPFGINMEWRKRPPRKK